MGKRYCLFLVFMICFSFAVAESGWDDTNIESSSGNSSGEVQINSSGVDSDAPPVLRGDDMEDGLGAIDKEYYTDDFYIALGLGVIVLIVIGLFVWFFLRGPRNKWD